MKRSGITWTAETLDKYIADPQAFIPGNRMPYAGMANASDLRRSRRLSAQGHQVALRLIFGETNQLRD
jgi:hypothetical protein